MPTYTELEELCKNFSFWTIDANGVKGRGFCGADLYPDTVPGVVFPPAGRRYSSGHDDGTGLCGFYWTSFATPSTYTNNYSNNLYFDDIDCFADPSSLGNRATGCSVRCVQDVSSAVAALVGIWRETYINKPYSWSSETVYEG